MHSLLESKLTSYVSGFPKCVSTIVLSLKAVQGPRCGGARTKVCGQCAVASAGGPGFSFPSGGASGGDSTDDSEGRTKHGVVKLTPQLGIPSEQRATSFAAVRVGVYVCLSLYGLFRTNSFRASSGHVGAAGPDGLQAHGLQTRMR